MPSKKDSSRDKRTPTKKGAQVSGTKTLWEKSKPKDRRFVAAFLSNKPHKIKTIDPAEEHEVETFYNNTIIGHVTDQKLHAFLMHVPVKEGGEMEHVTTMHKKMQKLPVARRILTAAIGKNPIKEVDLTEYLMAHPSPISYYRMCRKDPNINALPESKWEQVGKMIYGNRHKAYAHFNELSSACHNTREASFDNARIQAKTLHDTRRLTDGVSDGFKDAGPKARYSEEGALLEPMKGREIVVVDRPRDETLQKLINMAKATRPFSEERRMHELQLMLCRKFQKSHMKAIKTLQERQEEVFVGNVIDPSFPALCRHRALLFHTLAKHAGLKTAYVTGSRLIHQEPVDEVDHGWIEVELNGKTQVLDMFSPPEPASMQSKLPFFSA